jgi:1,4-dihydroxy-2-naphthoyl-CoA hydrolase
VTDNVEHLSAIGLGELAESMGMELTEASAARAVGRIPVAGNRQPFGLLHGGASAVLAETLGSIAAYLHGGPERVAVGIELSLSHHRSATTGYVTGTATALTLGRTLATYEIVVVDDEGARVCTSRLTCLLRDRPSA